MSFFFNDELNVNGKIITKDEIRTETSNTAINSNIVAEENNFYPLNGAILTILLPEITSSNQGSEIAFALLKTTGRSINFYANSGANQKILDNSGNEQNNFSDSNSTLQIVKYKSVLFPTDGVYFSISNTGSGYSTSDFISVTLSGGGGAGSSCSVSVKTGIVTGITITSGGSGYSPTDSLTFSTGFDFNGKIIVDSNGTITGLLIIDGGQNYSSSSFGFSGSPSGSGANISLVVSGSVPVISFQSSGSSYTSVPSISISGGSGSNLAITGTLNKGLWIST